MLKPLRVVDVGLNVAFCVADICKLNRAIVAEFCILNLWNANMKAHTCIFSNLEIEFCA